MVQNTEIMAPNQDLILPEVNEESSNNNEIFWILFFLAIFSLIVLVMAVSTFLILSILLSYNIEMINFCFVIIFYRHFS